jgi:RND family efflux transporter MFP subunit
MTSRPIMTLASALAVATLLPAGFAALSLPAAAQGAPAQGSPAQGKPVPRTVRVVAPEPATAAGKLSLSGRTAPAEQALVSARATGVVAERKVDIGDRVEAGDVLLTIEAPEIEHELSRARAALRQVCARLDIAKLNSARADQLTPKGFLSEQVRDERRASLQTAEADIAAAEAEVKRLEEVQGFQTVRAPFMGTIVARQVERGDKISGDQSQQGSFLFRIARLDPLRVEIDVPQSSALKIKPKDKARVTFAELPGEIFEAEVARMSHLIDQASSTMRAELMMPNPGRRIPAGLNGQVLFLLARDNTTVTVPSNTLAVRDGRQMVALVDAQSRVEFRPVVVGRDLGDRVEVTSGLGIVDRVILSPNALLRQGDEVAVHVDTAKSAENEKR